jgi:hypothetical protein
MRINAARKTLQEASILTSMGRSFDLLRLTDPYTNGFEFNSWYLKISSEWKDVAHADIVEYLLQLYTVMKPSLIVSIDNTQFATNVLHAIAWKDCKFITFQNSRFGSRWVHRFDLAFGALTSVDLRLSQQTQEELDGKIARYVQQYRNSSVGMYKAPSIVLGEKFKMRFRAKPGEWFSNFLYEVMKIVKHSSRSILFGPKSRKIPVKRFDQNFLKINIVEAKRRVFQFLPDSTLTPNCFPRKSYFYWTLHYRPEGSGLVLGHGIDELDLLVRVAKKLREYGASLVVKENPLMYGTRNRKTISEIKALSNVFFAPRYSASKEWIEHSRAVIGISGTSLLEAALLNIPSFAFGKPEFLSCVWSERDIDFNEFVEKCLVNQIHARSEDLRSYMRYIFANSSEDDVNLNPLTPKSDLDSSITRMETLVRASLDD